MQRHGIQRVLIPITDLGLVFFLQNVFNIENIIGLTVEFVDEEQNLIRYLKGDSATLAHLVFFACFLSVEGCKLLLLQDCFTVNLLKLNDS